MLHQDDCHDIGVDDDDGDDDDNDDDDDVVGGGGSFECSLASR